MMKMDYFLASRRRCKTDEWRGSAHCNWRRSVCFLLAPARTWRLGEVRWLILRRLKGNPAIQLASAGVTATALLMPRCDGNYRK